MSLDMHSKFIVMQVFGDKAQNNNQQLASAWKS